MQSSILLNELRCDKGKQAGDYPEDGAYDGIKMNTKVIDQNPSPTRRLAHSV